MDTSKEYIKMCDCPEIQEGWRSPLKGDFYFKKSRNYVCVYHEDEPFSWDDNIFLPRQDQLQEMIINDYELEFIKNAEYEYTLKFYFPATIYMKWDKPEKLFLQMYMLIEHDKTWNEDEWV